jgi:hypothetical protein
MAYRIHIRTSRLEKLDLDLDKNRPDPQHCSRFLALATTTMIKQHFLLFVWDRGRRALYCTLTHTTISIDSRGKVLVRKFHHVNDLCVKFCVLIEF